MAGHKDCSEGKQVFCKVALFLTFLLTVNHEFCVCFFEEPSQNLGSDSRKSVFVHDHNFPDISFVDEVQKGTQAESLEVDARGDVFDDSEVLALLVGRVLFLVSLLKVLDLSLEIVFLL